MKTRLARAIVAQYPPAWRERYEDEVLALVDDSSIRSIDVIELVRGLCVERFKALMEPSDHPVLTGCMLWASRFLPAPTLVLGGAGLGDQLGRTVGKAPDAVWITALGLAVAMISMAIGSRTAFITRSRSSLRRQISVMSVDVSFVFIVTFHWFVFGPLSDPASASLDHWAYWFRLVGWTTLTHQLLGRHWPWPPLLDALQEYQAAAASVRHAQDDVAQCEASIDDAARWRLVLAHEALDQFERERDLARARVDTFGYRARFSEPS